MIDQDPFFEPLKPKRTRAKSENPRGAKSYKPFTTDAAKEFAKSQGWRIVDSENYDFRTGLRHDCFLKSDVICVWLNRAKELRFLFIQAGTKGEENAHRFNAEEQAQKLAELLGIKPQDCTLELVCKRLGASFLWVEFSRGKKLPDRQVFWVGGES